MKIRTAISAVLISVASLVTFGVGQTHAAAASHKPPAIEVVSQTSDATPEVQQATAMHRHSMPLRVRALRQARRKRGDWYVYGTDGPNTFDCSGLVMWAYHHAGARGRRLARDTTEMLAQVGSVLRPVLHPKRGDLAFFGTGHVELWLGKVGGWGHHHWFVYGAEETGTQIHADEVFPGTSWWPTAFYQVV